MKTKQKKRAYFVHQFRSIHQIILVFRNLIQPHSAKEMAVYLVLRTLKYEKFVYFPIIKYRK